MGKCCSKGAGYDERLDISLQVKRYNTEENENNGDYADMRDGVIPRNTMNKKGSFVLEEDCFDTQGSA